MVKYFSIIFKKNLIYNKKRKKRTRPGEKIRMQLQDNVPPLPYFTCFICLRSGKKKESHSVVLEQLPCDLKRSWHSAWRVAAGAKRPTKVCHEEENSTRQS